MKNYTEEVAKDTNDPQILTDVLQRGNDDYVSCYAARNPNCPKEVLVEVLQRGKDDWASYYAARNPNCPPEALIEVLQRGKDDGVSYSAANNPNCPPEALALVLQRSKNDYVSRNAARNPNCPLPSLHQWLITTNNIDNPNPNFSKLSSKVKEYSQKLEQLEITLLQNTKLKFNNPILQLEI